MVTSWFDWYAGWETQPGLVVLDDPAMLPRVLTSPFGNRPGRLTVRSPGRDDLVPLGEGQHLRIRPYREVRLLPVDGWTVATLHQPEDFDAFLADADRAAGDAHLAAVLTDPRVQLAGLTTVGWPWPAADPTTRARIRADGTVTSGPDQRVLGRFDESPTTLARRWRWTLMTDDDSPTDHHDRARALADRPWLGDYLCAVVGVRAVRGHLGMLSSEESLEPVLGVEGWQGASESPLRRLVLQGRTWLVDLRRREVTAALDTAAMDRLHAPPIAVTVE